MSNNRWNIGQSVMSFDYDDKQLPYTKVRIITDDSDETKRYYEAGTNEGKVLEIYNPWGTQAMANAILANIDGYAYQPFQANGAFLPDDTELGDGIWIGNIYAPLVSQTIDFNLLGSSTISAPGGEDTDNEFDFDYMSSGERAILRQESRTTFLTVEQGLIRSEISDAVSQMSTTIEQTIESITLSVTSGENNTTFILKAGETELSTNTLDLHVKAVNVEGLLTASQIDVSTLHVGSGGITVDSGAISWGNLDSATQGSITTAVSNSSTAITNANSALGTVNQWVYPETTYIDGSQIMTGTVRAQNLYGGTCKLYYSIYSEGQYTDYVRGGFKLSATSTGIGVNLYSESGLKLTSGEDSNVYISAGAGASVSVENGIGLSGDYVAFTKNCWGKASPLNNSAVPAYNGGVYFQIVS